MQKSPPSTLYVRIIAQGYRDFDLPNKNGTYEQDKHISCSFFCLFREFYESIQKKLDNQQHQVNIATPKIRSCDVKMKTVCFSGYEPFLLGEDWNYSSSNAGHLKSIIRDTTEQLIHKGCTHFLCGFNQGCDLLFAEVLSDLKTQYLIKLESVLPYEEQAATWPEHVRERYFDLLAGCDEETLLRTQYSAGCHIRAAEYMIDHSDVLLAVCNGKVSTTTYAVRYAQAAGKQVVIINPFTFEVSGL